uniref:Uncharacterized protein n=1 Tax=Timema monikensis TaxID=170555 RepID=A0A7R9HL77_9NEOP|nr:unnamed protein product [Timema monikensis]
MGSDEKSNSHCIRVSVVVYNFTNGLEDCCVAFKKRVIDGGGLLAPPLPPRLKGRAVSLQSGKLMRVDGFRLEK